MNRFEAVDLRLTARALLSVQTSSGAIPWGPGRHVDPWNHVEAAMGLDAAGLYPDAEAAYRWLARSQRADGTWCAAYIGDEVFDPFVDANFIAYVATGCWHHFRCTSDEGFLRSMWPVVEKAIDAVLELQLVSGAIAWARSASGAPDERALLASSSSIHHSLWCAVAMADHLGHERPDWELSLASLGEAIRKGDDFEPKDRFAMDWYYPVLGGAISGAAGEERLGNGWPRFVVPGKGVRCTDDKPWVTAGETCELALSFIAVGKTDVAARLFEEVQHLRDPDDGLYWTGANHHDGSIYPHEKTTWSAGAALLVADALTGGPTATLFTTTTPTSLLTFLVRKPVT